MSEFEESFEYCRKRVGPKLALACAVDGSRVSKKALDLSVRLLSKREGGTLDLLHVEEPKAKVLLSGEHIRKECDLVTSSAEVPAEFHTIPKSEDASVTETLAKEAERHQADILVVGATGLKIEQGAVHADSFSVMGSVSDGSLHRSDVSVAIVKPTSHALERDGAMCYVLATDDSPSSRLAFALLVDKLADAKDTLHVYANREGAASMLEKYGDECAKRGLKCELHASHDHTTSVSDDILAHCVKSEADVLLVGTNGHSGEHILGSVSSRCAQSARCTVIVVKDPRVSD